MHRIPEAEANASDLISRAPAKARGLKRYRTGMACPSGHVAERYVSTGNCVDCQSENASRWRNEHRDRTQAYARERYWNDVESHNEMARKWREQNPEKQKLLTAQWHRKNPLGRRIHESRRRSRTQGTYTAEDIRDIEIEQDFQCFYCDAKIIDDYHVDHIIALSRGGSNTSGNIQLLCAGCNLRKHTKTHREFLHHQTRNQNMRFTPKSEDEITAANLLLGGEYVFEVVAASEEVSKAGNDMLKLQLAILDSDDRRHVVFDYLLSSDAAAYKLRHFAEAIGMLACYERGELTAEQIVGSTGKCQVGIDDKNKAYPPKNVIRDYAISKTNGATPPARSGQGPAPIDPMDQDIPFSAEWR